MDFYFHGGPNPMKVALMLEETGLPYRAIPIDIFKGQQHAPELAALNPNEKVPVLVDAGEVVFDSNAILLFLAEKTGRFADGTRSDLLSWLMFIATGLGPYSGQAVHFQYHAPERLPYAINRYHGEALRHFSILDQRLVSRPFLLEESYSIVDMAAWGWVNAASYVIGDADYGRLGHLQRWHTEVSARPAAQRALALREKMRFKAELDESARKELFGRKHVGTVVT